MTWQKLSDFPEQKVIGVYDIEFWAIIDGKVWHQGRKLAAADAASFEIFLDDPLAHSPFIARDATSVFHAWTRMGKIDRNSFTQYGQYWLDQQQVYLEHETSLKAVQHADPQSFRDLGHGYAADQHTAWYWGRQMKSCIHSQQLEVFTDNTLYASDTEQIYCDGKPLPRVNASQWHMLTAAFSTDNTSIYYLERKLPRVDIASWMHLDGPWSKDQQHVFYMNKIQKEYSAASFDLAEIAQHNAQHQF